MYPPVPVPSTYAPRFPNRPRLHLSQLFCSSPGIRRSTRKQWLHADPQHILTVLVAAVAANQPPPGTGADAVVVRPLPPQQHQQERMDIARRHLLARARHTNT